MPLRLTVSLNEQSLWWTVPLRWTMFSGLKNPQWMQRIKINCNGDRQILGTTMKSDKNKKLQWRQWKIKNCNEYGEK